MSHQSWRGFSLLEVLVVVAIVAIIGALAVPVSHRVIHKVNRARMQHHLRILGDDQILHQRDHGTFYPVGAPIGPFNFAFQIYLPNQPRRRVHQIVSGFKN